MYRGRKLAAYNFESYPINVSELLLAKLDFVVVQTAGGPECSDIIQRDEICEITIIIQRQMLTVQHTCETSSELIDFNPNFGLQIPTTCLWER